MKAVMFYMEGPQYEQSYEVKEFDSKDKLIDFINENPNVTPIAMYEVFKEIEIEPYEVVKSFRIKES